MKKYFRTDLACEAADDLKHIEGTEYSLSELGICTVDRLKILTREAAERLERALGSYVTLSTREIWKLDEEEISELAEVLKAELLSMITYICKIDKLSSDFSILVAGLGNVSITADAIGPETVERLTVTRHIKAFDTDLFADLGFCEVSAIIPGVLGKTGIESADVIRSAAEKVKPDVIIIIDALAAGAVERLATTIQLSDTGINPGAGIGNFRSELSRSTLGVPVISLGVPTVVDSSSLIYDAFMRAGIEQIPESMRELLENGVGYYVTPKETDMITEKVASLLSQAITEAMVIS